MTNISGGKQPLMKDGYFDNGNGERVIQPMVFSEGPYTGQAKGLRQVCLERFGAEAVQGKKQDCLGKVLFIMLIQLLKLGQILAVSLPTLPPKQFSRSWIINAAHLVLILFLLLVKMLETQPDFQNQKPLIVEAVEAVGGKVLFGAKFTPELMPIENSYRFFFNTQYVLFLTYIFL